jgi:hypothetical protein
MSALNFTQQLLLPEDFRVLDFSLHYVLLQGVAKKHERLFHLL